MVQKDLSRGLTLLMRRKSERNISFPHLRLVLKPLKMQLIHDSRLPSLKSFILPSGSELSCRLHLCRTYARNLERKASSFDKSHEPMPDNYLIFLNRLSDYLFVAARFVNYQKQVQEVNWP